MARERIQATVFDSFPIRGLRPLLKSGTSGDTIMFYVFGGGGNECIGNEYIGNHIRTNRCAVHVCASDQEFHLKGWWASSNVGGCQLDTYRAWQMATQVTLVVNGTPVWNRALYGLAQTPHYVCPELAEPMPDAGRVLFERVKESSWERCPTEYRQIWNRIATDLDMAPAYVIPGRSSVKVRVECDRRATAAFLETMPANVAPEALVWIHLDGVMTRPA